MAGKQLVPINLTGGIQESTSDQLVTKLIQMENAWYIKTGVLAIRPGYTRPVDASRIGVSNYASGRAQPFVPTGTFNPYTLSDMRPAHLVSYKERSLVIWRDVLADYSDSLGTVAGSRVMMDQVSEATSEIQNVASLTTGLREPSMLDMTVGGKDITLVVYRDAKFELTGLLRFSVIRRGVSDGAGAFIHNDTSLEISPSEASGSPIVLPWTSTKAIVIYSSQDGSVFIRYIIIDLTNLALPDASVRGVVSVNTPQYGLNTTSSSTAQAARLISASARLISGSYTIAYVYVDTSGNTRVGKIVQGSPVTITEASIGSALGFDLASAVDVTWKSDTVFTIAVSVSQVAGSYVVIREVALSTLLEITSWLLTNDAGRADGCSYVRISLTSVGSDYLIAGNTSGGTSDFGKCVKWVYLVTASTTWYRWRINGEFEMFSRVYVKTDTTWSGSAYTRYYALIGGTGCALSPNVVETQFPALYLVELKGVGQASTSTTVDNWTTARIVSTVLPVGSFGGFNYASAGLAPTSGDSAKWLPPLSESISSGLTFSKDRAVSAYAVISNSYTLYSVASSIIRIKFEFYKNKCSEQWMNGTVLGGGSLEYFDGVRVAEIGAPHVFAAPTWAIASGSGGAAVSTFNYVYILEYTDSEGNTQQLGRSAKSNNVTTATLNEVYTVTIPTCGLMKSQDWENFYNGDVRVKVYRLDGGVYYLVGTANHVANTRVVTVTDTLATDITVNPTLYTLGFDGTSGSGPLPNYAPPSSKCMEYYDNRLWLGGTSTGEIYYSKPQIPTELPQFNSTLTVAPFTGGDVVALASQETYLVVFKKTSVWYISGTGSDETGNNSTLTPPVNISFEQGCSNPNTVVATSTGVFFEGRNGIYFLEKNTFKISYVGFDVEDQTANPNYECYGAVSTQDGDLIRFLYASKTGSDVSPFVLVYDTRFKSWSKWTYRSDTYNNACAITQTRFSTGTGVNMLFWESGGETLETGYRDEYQLGLYDAINAVVETGWIALSGLLAESRISRVGILGEMFGPNTFNYMYQYIDYVETAVKTWGASGQTTTPFKQEFLCSSQRCTSIKFKFSWYNSVGQESRGLEITGMGVLANQIPGKDRVRPTRRTSGT